MDSLHTIEFNGEFYDADSGKKLSGIKADLGVKGSTDGFSRPPRHAARKTSPHHGRPPAKKSTTLKRQSVHKPAHRAKPVNSTKTKPEVEHKEIKTILHTSQPTSIGRADRLKTVPKSHMIKRFSYAKATTQATPSSRETPDIAASSAGAIEYHPHVQRALSQAVSHEQPKAKKPKRKHRLASWLHISPKTFNVGAAVLAVLILVGFYGYMNKPNLAMRVAAARSHVDGSLPSYKPSGFSLNGSIKYRAGEILLSYKSNSDNRNFVIAQRSSAWNSETLKQNYLASKSPESYTQKGKIIYLYEGSNATWVDSGVWYVIEGDSKLSTDQLLKLAAGL